MQMNIKLMIIRTIISCSVSLLILGLISYCIPEMNTMVQMNKSFKLNNKSYNLNSYEYSIASSCIVPSYDESLSNVIGHDDIIQEIKTLIDVMNNSGNIDFTFDAPKGILLYGPPGTGKTTLAKSISSSIHSGENNKSATFLMVSPDVIENKFYGESLKLLKAVFTLAKKISPCVIFFDEIDGILSTRTVMDQSHTTSMKTSFLTHLDTLNTNSVIMIGATNREKSLDTALLRRLSVHLKLGNPSDKDKKTMLSNHFTKLSNDNLTELVDTLPKSMTLSDIECFCKYCYRHFFTQHKKSGSVMNVDEITNMYPIYEKFRVKINN